MLVRAVRPFTYQNQTVAVGQSVEMPDVEAAAHMAEGTVTPAGVMTRASLPWI